MEQVQTSIRTLDKIVALIGDLPATPGIVSQLMSLTSDININIDKITRAVMSDQSFTARVLRLSNSSFYGRSKEVRTLKEAIVILGFKTLRSLVVAMSTHSLYRGESKSTVSQSLWEHALATAICAREISRAARFGQSEEAFIAGLLHDIGKVPDDEPELPHAVFGMKLAEKYKEKPEICNAIGSHHDEVEMQTLLAPIVQVCDAISGARPGARREVVESYIKRLKDLEDLALSYPGVMKTYAIQAGREIRIMVQPDRISDEDSVVLSRDIARKIEKELTYPGQIKVTVIREMRAVELAK